MSGGGVCSLSFVNIDEILDREGLSVNEDKTEDNPPLFFIKMGSRLSKFKPLLAGVGGLL